MAGEAQRLALGSLVELAALLPQLTPAQALAYGVPAHESARVVTRDALRRVHESARSFGESTDGVPVIARDREHFQWPAGPGILMLDYDPPDAPDPLSPPRFREALYEAWPALRVAPHLWRPSAGSCIYRQDTGEELRGILGQRLYVAVAEASDIARAGAALAARLWLAGRGRYEVSTSGQLLERTLIDTAVWQPERLDFCGGAECAPPLEQRLPEPVVFNADAPPVDTRRALPELTLKEEQLLDETRRAASGSEAIQRRRRQAQERWVEERIATFTAEHPDRDADELRRQLHRAVEGGRLYGDFPLLLEDGTPITVGEVLDDVERFHNRRCADPLEPEYQNDRRIAWLNLRAGGRPYLYSHAHGGRRYTLHRAPALIRLEGGELHNQVDRVLEILRLDGAVYDRGGELVWVTDDDRIIPITPEYLQVFLMRLIQFERWKGRKDEGDWYPEDCPLSLSRAVLAQRGAWQLPRLHAVLSAPTMTPDGRVIATAGYDPPTGVLLQLRDPVAELPSEPSPEEVRRALAALWFPFRDFPFVGAVDRGVMLAALLTAVVRALLPTAPGFLFMAPTAGSGKSLLASCVGVLAGVPRPARMPSTRQEEEFRKRLLAVARESRAAVLLDNVSGHIESDALCAYLTSDHYADRLLGVSNTVEVPVTGIFMVTGNNVTLVGDLNRRLLTCRIDPGVERPYRRAFDLDPLDHVREHRQALVRAALTVLNGYLANRQWLGPMTPDRTASFEAWSDLVRQAVLWAKEAAPFPIGDPCDAIDAGYDEDPETNKLTALLTNWWAAFRDKPRAISEVCAFARSPFPAEGADPGVQQRLHSALLEIAGEGDAINTRRLGRWVERMQDRPAGGLVFRRGRLSQGVLQWQVAATGGGFGGFGGFSDPYA